MPGAFALTQVKTLPPAAWLAEIRGHEVRAWCGSSVEVFDDGFVEGCWDGAFHQAGFVRARNRFGSGLFRVGDDVVAAGPSHTLEALYVHETVRHVSVSNSLAFLLEHERVPVPADASVCRRLATLVLGLDAYEQVLFEHSTGQILRIACSVVRFSEGGMDSEVTIPDQPLRDFDALKQRLSETLRAVFENGASPRRRRALHPIATVSSGYDSAACAALAAPLGCSEALTLETARSGRRDTGAEVARALGYTVHAFPRWREGGGTGLGNEPEFLASGMGGEDLPLSVFERHLSGRILLTGFYGGETRLVSGDGNRALMARVDLSGSSLVEFRLRTGFAHVPILFMGCARTGDVRRIGLTDELSPWRLGNDYDKPVLRRIIEEAGVPRHVFGQRKEAGSALLFQRLAFYASPVRSNLRRFAATRRRPARRLKQAVWSARFWSWRCLRKAAALCGIARLPDRIEQIVLGEDWRVFEHSSPDAELAFRWGLRKTRRRYRFAAGRDPIE